MNGEIKQIPLASLDVLLNSESCRANVSGRFARTDGMQQDNI